jgi:hypothetical protein
MVELSKFAYLPETISLITLEFIIIVGLFYYKYVYKVCTLDQNDNQRMNIFENTYRSFSPSLTYILFITRTLSLGYILGISVIANDIIDHGGWYFFTNWNTNLISIYFISSLSCSICGLIYDDPTNMYQTAKNDTNTINQADNILWSPKISFCSQLLLGLFSICGGTAILVTVNFNRNEYV